VAKLRKGVYEYNANVMDANEILMARGEKITLVVQKADNLRTESSNYFYKVNNN
jgi:hypothetical protein